MNLYQKTIKELKNQLNKNPRLKREEWDIYAKQYKLLSSIVIYAHEDVEHWEDLKNKIKKIDKKLEKEIEKIRKKLNRSIVINGINSKQTHQINDEINELINLYYEVVKENNRKRAKNYPVNSKLYEWYKYSYKKLKEETKKTGKFPTVNEWTILAKKYEYNSYQVIEYISGLTWNEIREKILKEINI